MSALAAHLALTLGRRFEVFVFPAWGTEPEVFVHSDLPSGICYLGMSERLWLKVQREHTLRTGKALQAGNVSVRVVPGDMDQITVVPPRDLRRLTITAPAAQYLPQKMREGPLVEMRRPESAAAITARRLKAQSEFLASLPDPGPVAGEEELVTEVKLPRPIDLLCELTERDGDVPHDLPRRKP